MDNDNNTISAAALPRCVCTWKNCRAYQKVFREAKHETLDGVVRIKLLKGHPESIMYKECLDRTLGVVKEPEWKDTKGSSPYCKYIVARHHFTEQHLARYDANPKTFSFVKPFTLHGAKKYLYSVNPKETMNVTDDPNEALYLQCPNVPSDVVKSEYYKAHEIIKGERQSESGGGDGTSRTPTVTNKSNRKGSTYHEEAFDDDDAKSVGTSASNIEILKTKEAENKILKDQLDAMKSQLSFLHDMVEKLQAQHFDNGSVYSRNSRPSGTNRNRNVRNKQQDRSNNTKKNGQQFNASHTRVGRSGASVQTKGSVPDEIGFEDDQVSQWNENDYGSEDERTQLTAGTFQSRFQPLPTHDDADDSEEEEEDEDENDDYNDYNESMSLGTSTILSASKSVKTLPRELELDEDEDDSDTHESLEEEAFENRSVSSSYYQSPSGSHQSFSTFGKPTSPKKSKQNAVAPVSRNSRRSSMASSTASSTMDPTDVQPMSRRRSTTSSTASSSLAGSVSLYNVDSLEVTDPYGEKGTYTGSISKSTGMPHGHGRLEYDEAGRWYEGYWKHGRWTGYGVLANGDGDFYRGKFKNDHKHGEGKMQFADGRTFEGKYNRGQMVKGKMTYQDGSTYDGGWVDGMRHGYGRCVFSDHSVYEGDFKEGEFCGHGKMTWNDGGWYEGTWLNGDMHGRGREIRADGSLRHDGEWVKGQPVRHKRSEKT